MDTILKYIRPVEGTYEAHVAPGDNEFDSPGKSPFRRSLAQPLLGPASWLQCCLVLSLAPLLRVQTWPHRDAHCHDQFISMRRVGAGDAVPRLGLGPPPPWKYHPEKNQELVVAYQRFLKTLIGDFVLSHQTEGSEG